MRRRKAITAKVRWEIFKRDGFKCQYCGSDKELVIDHGDPFAAGGEDSADNFITACRDCNAGKRDSVLIPPQAGGDKDAVVRRGVAYKNSLLADWGEALRHVAMSVEYLPGSEEVECLTRDDRRSVIRPDFLCEFVDDRIGFAYMVVVPLCDRGTYSPADRVRIRDASILGYKRPTVTVMGSPWHFYAFLVNDRHKGCPHGLLLSEDFSALDSACAGGWYPDETWEFSDPRDEFYGLRPMCFSYRGWMMSTGEGFEEARKEAGL